MGFMKEIFETAQIVQKIRENCNSQKSGGNFRGSQKSARLLAELIEQSALHLISQTFIRREVWKKSYRCINDPRWQLEPYSKSLV